MSASNEEEINSSSDIDLTQVMNDIKQKISNCNCWDNCRVKQIRNHIDKEALFKWIELLFCDGLVLLKKAEAVTSLKETYNITTQDMNQAFLIHKNGPNATLPQDDRTSEYFTYDIRKEMIEDSIKEWL